MKTWWFLWRLFLFRKWTVTLQVVSAIVMMVVVEHAAALVQREIFDTLTGDAGISLGVWTLCAVLVALALGHTAASVGDEMLWRFNRFTLASLMQRNAFDHALELSGDRSLPASPGEAVSRLRDDPRLTLLYVLDFDIVVAHLLFLIVAMAIMLQISATTAVFVFLPMAAIMLVTHVMRERIGRYRKAAREAAGGVAGFIGEMFGMVETIKASNAESRVIDEFNRANERRGRTSLKDEVFVEMLRAVSSNLHNIGTGLVLVLLARSMSQGTLTVGDLSLFVFYLAQTQSFTSAIGDLMAGYRQIGVSVNRLLDLMPGSAPEKLVEPTPSYLMGPLPNVEVPEKKAGDRLEALDVEGLTYVHPNSGEGVRDVSFSLRRGDFTVVTGAVGSGKTTLLRALVGWLPPQNGDRQVERLRGRRWRACAGAAALRVPVAGPKPLQRAAAGQHTHGPSRGTGRPSGRREVRRAGAGRGRAGGRSGHARRPARRETLGRPAASLGRGEVLRPGARPAGHGRRLERPGRGDRADALGAAVRARRQDRAGRVAPTSGVRASRPHHRAEERTRRVPGQAGIPPRDLGGDAAAMGRRCRQPVRGGRR